MKLPRLPRVTWMLMSFLTTVIIFDIVVMILVKKIIWMTAAPIAALFFVYKIGKDQQESRDRHEAFMNEHNQLMAKIRQMKNDPSI